MQIGNTYSHEMQATVKDSERVKRGAEQCAETGSAELAVEPTIGKEEVGRLLGIQPDTVAKWANAGRLPAHRVGRRWRFFWSEIRARMTEEKAEGGKLKPEIKGGGR